MLKLEKVILKLRKVISSHSETGKGHLEIKKNIFMHMPPPRTPKGSWGSLGMTKNPPCEPKWLPCTSPETPKGFERAPQSVPGWLPGHPNAPNTTTTEAHHSTQNHSTKITARRSTKNHSTKNHSTSQHQKTLHQKSQHQNHSTSQHQKSQHQTSQHIKPVQDCF